MNRIIPLEVEFDYLGTVNTIFPVILIDDNEMILIDCGYPDFFHLIKAAAKSKGIDIDKLTKLIITHHDYDHMGALAEFKKMYPHTEILSSVEEGKYISGKVKSLRLQQAEELYDALPQEQKAGALAFQRMLEDIETVDIDGVLRDKDLFEWCGGVEIIATPGHTPGHLSLYLKEYKTLISGDALVIEHGSLAIANPQYTLDMPGAKKSIARLLDYEIDRIVCYHGGIYEGNIKEALRKLI